MDAELPDVSGDSSHLDLELWVIVHAAPGRLEAYLSTPSWSQPDPPELRPSEPVPLGGVALTAE